MVLINDLVPKTRGLVDFLPVPPGDVRGYLIIIFLDVPLLWLRQIQPSFRVGENFKTSGPALQNKALPV